ncbi:MAG: cobyric acid synthase, partial [Hyphomicrobiaceae bacterium]
VLGLCGGYQMLGRVIADPLGIEGPPRQVEGLGLLDVHTELTGTKVLREVAGLEPASGAPFQGYEMHVGATAGPDAKRPLLHFADGRRDGASSADGRVCGCYVHGLFASDRLRAAWLARLGGSGSVQPYEATVETALDALAAHLGRHIDIQTLLSFARRSPLRPPVPLS